MESLPVRYGRIALLVPVFALCAGLGPLLAMMTVEAFEIDGPSMAPTLASGSRVVIHKSGLWLPGTQEALAAWDDIEVGDVVVVVSPADHVDIVKRVVGVAGDHIEILEDGTLMRNGQTVSRASGEPCPTLDSQFPAEPGCMLFDEELGAHRFRAAWDPEFIYGGGNFDVPEGTVFVLGDRRDRSNDSRRIGPVPVSMIKGSVLFQYWDGGES